MAARSVNTALTIAATAASIVTTVAAMVSIAIATEAPAITTVATAVAVVVRAAHIVAFSVAMAGKEEDLKAQLQASQGKLLEVESRVNQERPN